MILLLGYDIVLFKTNLYPSHENVIIPTKGDLEGDQSGGGAYHSKVYYNLLKTLYDSVHINHSARNSIKVYDSINYTLTINVLASSILQGYNYVAINAPAVQSGDKSHIKYFFITDIESLNDNYEYPSCRLTLKYDTWGNHYEEIISSKNTGTLYKGHDKSVNVDSSLHIRNLSTENGIGQYYSVIKPLYGEYEVVWLEVILTEPQYFTPYTYISTDRTSLYPVDITYYLSKQYGKYMFYIPLFAKNFRGGAIHPITKIGGTYFLYNTSGGYVQVGNGSPGDYVYYERSSEISLSTLIPWSLKSYISSARLTVHAPFDYIYYADGRLIIQGVPIFTSKESDYIYVGLGAKAINGVNVIEGGSEETINLVTNKMYSIKKIDTISSNTDINNYNSLMTSNYTPPYYDKRLIINGHSYSIINGEYLDEDITVNIILNSSQPYIRIRNSNNNINGAGTFIKITPTVSYTIDSLQDYLIRNGAQLTVSEEVAKINKTAAITNGIFTSVKGGVNAASSLLGMFGSSYLSSMAFSTGNIAGSYGSDLRTLGYGTSGVGGVVDIFKGVSDAIINSQLAEKQIDLINAKKDDVDNSPDVMVSSRGEDDLYLLDSILIEERYYLGNTNDIESIFYNEYRYGILPNKKTTIYQRFKTSFDYKKFLNVDLTDIKLPLQIVNDITEFLKRGFTIHYCDGEWGKVLPNMEYGFNMLFTPSILSGFNPDTINNVDKEFRFDNSYIEWLGRRV